PRVARRRPWRADRGRSSSQAFSRDATGSPVGRGDVAGVPAALVALRRKLGTTGGRGAGARCLDARAFRRVDTPTARAAAAPRGDFRSVLPGALATAAPRRRPGLVGAAGELAVALEAPAAGEPGRLRRRRCPRQTPVSRPYVGHDGKAAH